MVLLAETRKGKVLAQLFYVGVCMAKKTWSDLEKPKKKKGKQDNYESRIEPTSGGMVRLFPELAMEIGLNESLLFLQFEYWLGSVKDDAKRMQEGRKWVWNSVRNIQDTLPFWAVGTIHKTLKSLMAKGLLLKAAKNYNARGFDRTGWYAIDWDVVKMLHSIREKEGCSRIEHTVHSVQEKPPKMNDYTIE